MNCPGCGNRQTEVLETRRHAVGTDVERRHRCSCGGRWTSIQKLVRGTFHTTGRATGSAPVARPQPAEPPLDTTGSPPGSPGGVGGGLSSGLVLSLPDPSGSLEARSQLRADLMSVLARYRHWHPRAIPHPSAATKELGLIKARLAEGYTAEELCKCIDGYHQSPHHLGQNERQTKYLSLALFMRDASHVQAGLEFMDKVEPRPKVQATAASPLEAYCEWHRQAVNAGRPTKYPKPGCPDCKHLAAKANGRTSAVPSTLGALDEPLPDWAERTR